MVLAANFYVKFGNYMSRIGKKPITIASGITLNITPAHVQVTGPKGVLTVPMSEEVVVTVEGSEARVVPKTEGKHLDLVGLYRSLLYNAVVGVSTGWTKSLEIIGVGYRAQTDGRELTLHLGFAVPVKIQAVEGITFTVTDNKITVSGTDKYVIGETAAQIREKKKPEPYKGKGIRYVGEVVRKKVGKAGKAVGGAGGKK